MPVGPAVDPKKHLKCGYSFIQPVVGMGDMYHGLFRAFLFR